MRRGNMRLATRKGLQSAEWHSILEDALHSFGPGELARHALRTKPESRLRDALAAAMERHLGQSVVTEWPVAKGFVDVVALYRGEPTIWLELKTGYSFDATCSGGAILLAGKYGRSHSVASDVAKLQQVASGQAYVMYASVHPAGVLPSWACGTSMVRDYFNKHASALRRYAQHGQLLSAVDRMCERFGLSGEVGGHRAMMGRFPLQHVLTHHAYIGDALNVSVFLRTWVWQLPLP
jgi:hypothetical protein